MMSFDGGVLGPASMTKPCSESAEMPSEVLRAPQLIKLSPGSEQRVW